MSYNYETSFKTSSPKAIQTQEQPEDYRNLACQECYKLADGTAECGCCGSWPQAFYVCPHCGKDVTNTYVGYCTPVACCSSCGKSITFNDVTSQGLDTDGDYEDKAMVMEYVSQSLIHDPMEEDYEHGASMLIQNGYKPEDLSDGKLKDTMIKLMQD